jgi:hypothetical protein
MTLGDIERLAPASLRDLIVALVEEAPAFETGEEFNSRVRISSSGIQVSRLRAHVDRDGVLLIAAIPLLVLDATPIPALVDHLCSAHDRLADVSGAVQLPANVTVVQYAAAGNGHRALALSPDALARVVKEVEDERARFPTATSSLEAVVAYKSVAPVLRKLGFVGERVFNFGAVRGTNSLETVHRLHVVGRPMPPTEDMHYLAQVLHHDEGYVSPQLVLRPTPFGGQPYMVDVVDYADPRLAQLLKAAREDEMLHAIYRARPDTVGEVPGAECPEGVRPLRLVLHTSLPLPGLRIDDLLLGQAEATDVNADRRRESGERIDAAIIRLSGRNERLSIAAISREARANWGTVKSHLGTVRHTVSERTDDSPALPDSMEPSRVADDATGTTRHTPITDSKRGVHTSPERHIPSGPRVWPCRVCVER